jgi:putative SOS response-associated peptidase YedK
MPVWFALDEGRPLAYFAGIWTSWTLTRKLAEGEVTADLFGFLTPDANAEVGAVHPKAMPVILTREEELDTWLAAPWPEAHGCSALYRRATGRLATDRTEVREDGRGRASRRGDSMTRPRSHRRLIRSPRRRGREVRAGR